MLRSDPATQEPLTPLVSRLTAIPDTPEQHHATELLSGEPGIYGFVVLDADGTILASHNGELPFITASTYKLVLMADIYRRIEQGILSLDQPVMLDAALFGNYGDMYFAHEDIWSSFPLQEYLFAMGAYSSNAAARTLLTLTSPTVLRQTAVTIGMENTHLFVNVVDLPMWPPLPGVDGSVDDLLAAQIYLEQSVLEEGSVSITTPLDMARYQLAMLHGTLISPWASSQIATILEQQLIRDRIPFFFEDIQVLNKPGNLDDAVNDVGVLYLDDGPRAVVTLAQNVPDTDRATLIEQRLALIAAGVEDIPPIPDDFESEYT